jgi:hypothetical protein
MQRLEKWLEQRNFSLEVEVGADDSVCFEERTVYINSKTTKNAQLSTLLHECGHVHIFMERQRCKRRRCGGATWSQWKRLPDTNRLPLKDKILTVAEEIEAWDRGLDLRKKLRIRVPLRTYRMVQTRSLMTYVRWCGKRAGH